MSAKLSKQLDTQFLQALALRIGELGDNGNQALVQGVIGAPEGRLLGSTGDVAFRVDAPSIWQKQSGPRSKLGWTQLEPGIQGPQGDQGPQGNEGQQGDTGASDAFGNVLATLPGSTPTGLRAGLGLNTGFTGLTSSPALAPTNLLTSTLRGRISTAGVGTGQAVAARSGIGQSWRGNAAGLGGFDVSWRFALTGFGVGFRAFTGFRAIVGLIPDVNPSTLVNIIGMGFDAGSSQWAILHNDAAGAATVVALGAAFNVDVSHLLEIQLTCAANGASVDWTVRNLSTGAVASGNLAANIPANTIFLASHVWANTGTNAVTIPALDLPDIILDSPTPTTP